MLAIVCSYLGMNLRSALRPLALLNAMPGMGLVSQGDSRVGSPKETRVGSPKATLASGSPKETRVGWRCPRQCQRFGSGAAQGTAQPQGLALLNAAA